MSYFVSILRGVRDIFFIKLFSSVVLINLEIFLNYIKLREIYIYIYIERERERERERGVLLINILWLKIFFVCVIIGRGTPRSRKLAALIVK